MKRLLIFALALLMMLSCVACKASKKHGSGGLSTSNPPATTVPNTTDPSATTPEQTTPPQTTEEPYEPIYEHEGFKYEIDIKPYLSYICTGLDRQYLIIANRYHPLGKYYTPSDLVYVMEGSSWQLREAKSSL